MLFTVVLLAMYLPAVALLRLKVLMLGGDQIIQPDRGARGIAGTLRVLGTLVQLFAPMLLGLPLDKLVTVLVQLTSGEPSTIP